MATSAIYDATRKRVEEQLAQAYKLFGPLGREDLASLMDGAQDAVMNWLPDGVQPQPTEYATLIGEDDLNCPCGNRPHLDGFYLSTADGTPVQPADWDGGHSVCFRCNRIIDEAGDLAVVGFASDENVELASEMAPEV